jgi:hypothetical protein
MPPTTSAPAIAGRGWKMSSRTTTWCFPARASSPDGLEARKQMIERGYEGYVAKDEASAYEGGPTRRWLKVKQGGRRTEEVAA